MSDVASADLVARNRRMLIIAGVVVLLGIIVAGGYWYTKAPSAAPVGEPGLPLAIDGSDLLVGPANAKHHLVVPSCVGFSDRDFELATRSFLRADARLGLVQVRYVGASAGAARSADPKVVLAARDHAYDASTMSLDVLCMPSLDDARLDPGKLSPQQWPDWLEQQLTH